MKILRSIVTIALFAGALSFVVTGCSTEGHGHSNHMEAASGSYPLTKCVVSGDDLGDKPYVFVRNGQQVKLCCKDCLAKFNEAPEKYLAKLNEAK
jgi:hypothetical protein